jgi:hypothetical protein
MRPGLGPVRSEASKPDAQSHHVHTEFHGEESYWRYAPVTA